LAKACDKYLQRRKVKKLTELLDSNIEVALTDPNISDEEKEKLKKERKEIQLDKITNLAKKIRSIQSDE
jgi:hypothetical protein